MTVLSHNGSDVTRSWAAPRMGVDFDQLTFEFLAILTFGQTLLHSSIGSGMGHSWVIRWFVFVNPLVEATVGICC